MKLIKNKKHRKIAMIISIPILLIIQFYLFKFGILSPMLKGVEIQIVDGEHIQDIDKYVVKLNDSVELSKGDYIKIPMYAKDPDIKFKVLDDTGVLKIEGNKMTSLKEGYASIGIMKGSRVLQRAAIKVVDPKVESLNLKIDGDLKYVGDRAKIDSTIEVDYEEFKDSHKVQYRSSDKNVLQIEGNEVKAVGVGTAVIYAKSGDKEVKQIYKIEAKVAKIDIDKTIEIELHQTKKLEPKIITNPRGLKHPRISFELQGRKLSISRAIRLDDDGTIKAIRLGEETVKITCGNKSEYVTIKVVEKSITNKNIENFEVSKEILDNKMILTLTWDYIKGVNDYEIYLRNNSLGEKEFTNIQTITVNDDESEIKTRAEYIHSIDISNIDNVDIDIYVVGKTDKGKTKKSKTENVKYSKDQNPDLDLDKIQNLSWSKDSESKIIKLTWDHIDGENISYSVYVKDNSKEESEFSLYKEGINSNEFDVSMPEGELNLEIYIASTHNGKIIKSDTINIK